MAASESEYVMLSRLAGNDLVFVSAGNGYFLGCPLATVWWTSLQSVSLLFSPDLNPPSLFSQLHLLRCFTLFSFGIDLSSSSSYSRALSLLLSGCVNYRCLNRGYPLFCYEQSPPFPIGRDSAFYALPYAIGQNGTGSRLR